jgi:hypothetical protein
MRTVSGRIDRLEQRLGIGKGRRMPLTIASLAYGGLNKDKCLQILEECGFLHSQTYLVNLCFIPLGLNEQELERFLRTRGVEPCFPLPPGYTGPIAGIQRDSDPPE